MSSRTLCMFMCILAAVGPCHAWRTQLFQMLQSRSLTLLNYSTRQADKLRSSSLEWPETWPWPWDEVDRTGSFHNRAPRKLGEGSFGIATRYYTKCKNINTDQYDSVVVKKVKQSRSMAMYERVETCKEALVETSVQMQMAEKNLAVRVFALNPKRCDEGTLQDHPETYIMMARAQDDGKFNAGKAPGAPLMLDIAQQLFQGVYGLHRLGYLHRDIKPGNLLFEAAPDNIVSSWEDCKPGKCRFTLSDYGLACKRKIAKWGGKTTCTEFSCGTPFFVPPEIAKSILTGDRTEYYYSRGMDYWALGITLYEMAFQKLPGGLDACCSVVSLRRYLRDLRETRQGDVNWWKKDENCDTREEEEANGLKKNCVRTFIDNTTDHNVELFGKILSKLLIPSQSGRIGAVHSDMPALMKQIGKTSVQIPSVCVDPCNKCYQQGQECRAEHLLWMCVQPPPATIGVSVTVIDDSIYGTWSYYDDQEKLLGSFDIIDKDGVTFISGTNLFSKSRSVFSGKLRLQVETGWLVAELWASKTHLGWLGFRSSCGAGMAWSNCGVGQLTYRPADSDSFGNLFTAHAANRIEIKFELDDSNIRGNELRDLKVLVAEKFKMDVEQAAFFFDGSDDPLEDIQNLGEGFKLYLSPPLRQALVFGPLVGQPLADAIADATRTMQMQSQITFPYFDMAQDIANVWPAQRWPSASRALRSQNIADQASLANDLRPIVEKAKKFFQVPSPLVAWSKLLDDLSAPLGERMEEDRKQAMSKTNERCQQVGYTYCAQEVRMEMADEVDYVKVEYKYTDAHETTKLKFFNDGRIRKTRGTGVAKHKAVTLDAPTLPGSITLTITLCRNMKAQSACKMNVGNWFVKSETRCEDIGAPIKYTLRSDGATILPQENVLERLQMKFQVSTPPDHPEVAFYVWDGNYQLA